MASAVIGALRVNLGIDTAQFTEGLKGARAALDNAGKSMQKVGGKLSAYVSAPLTAAGLAITGIVTSMSRDMDELRKAADISNVGFEQFQKLAFAAKSVGIEGDKLADIFKDVNDRVGDFNATGGGPMKDFFDNIAPKVGITAEAFKNLSGPQALQLYYDSLVKAGASQQDMTFYLEAMASDATALIPLLRDGGKAFDELGEKARVISDGEANQLKAYNDAMRAMGEALKGLALAIAGSGILEFLTDMVQHLTVFMNWLSQTNPEILRFGVVFAGLAAAIGPALVALGLVVSAVAAISLPVAAAVAGIAALTAAVIAFWPEIKAAGAAVLEFVQGAWAQFLAAWDNVSTKVAAATQAVMKFAADIVAAFAAIPAKMLEIGTQIIDGLWQGIQAKWESVKAGISGLAGSITSSIKAKLGIQSPSRVMHEVGLNITEGLANGMSEGKGTVESVAGDLGSGIEGVFEGIGSSIADAIAGTKSWKDVALDALKSVAQFLMSKMDFGGGIFGSLLKGLFGGLTGFASGGTIMPGGFGGIDSQVVMFRKSPNERVDITKPGQTLGGGSQEVVVRGVFVDDNGVIKAQITDMGRTAAQAGSSMAISRVRDNLPGLMADAQMRSM